MGSERLQHLIRFYAILDQLEKTIGGARRLVNCDGRLAGQDGVEPAESKLNKGVMPAEVCNSGFVSLRLSRIAVGYLHDGDEVWLTDRKATNRILQISTIFSVRTRSLRNVVVSFCQPVCA